MQTKNDNIKLADENSIGIAVKLKADYAVVCETLERIGVVNKKDKKIYPSCYCHKIETDNGSFIYKICHFKEMFLLQGKPSSFNKTDKLRLKTITYFLQRWNLVELQDASVIDQIMKEHIDVVPYSEKKQYTIVHKFRHNTKV